MNIAIVVVAYNRVDSLCRLLSSIERAYYNEDATLIISIDKSDSDIVEVFADNYIWSRGRKIVDKHEENLGLRPHMLSLGKWFSQFDAIIVLEDDIVVSPSYYLYTQQCVDKYHTCSDIAGISLYSFQVNYLTGYPWQPIKDENDVFFMNCAMSWGEIWMRNSWERFYEWYLKHQEFSDTPHVPRNICKWNSKSWLKYHTRYCIEENKYFVYPYTSLSTNFGDAGVHKEESGGTLYQVRLQDGLKEYFILPELGEESLCYDVYFENKSLYPILGFKPSEICLDLNRGSHNRENKRYWLTTEKKNYRIIKSFGLNYRPIECNIIYNNVGSQIYLYDTRIVEHNKAKRTRKDITYFYQIGNIISFLKEYELKNLFSALMKKIKSKIC